MPRAEKEARVAELKERIVASDALLLAEYRGLTVADITELRRALADSGARFSVVKNTLMRRAAADAAIAELASLFEGPTAVAFVAGDAVAAAKKVVDAAKKYPTLVIKGGYLDGRVLSAEDARSLADLESREAMLSRIAGLVKSEMSRAASMFQSLQAEFLGLLDAYKEKVPGESEGEAAVTPGTTVEAAEEPAAEQPAAALSEEAPASEEASEAEASDEHEEE